MIIALVAFGLLFGLSAAGLTYLSGGTIFLIFVAYSGAGTLALLGFMLVVLIRFDTKPASKDWLEGRKDQGPISA